MFDTTTKSGGCVDCSATNSINGGLQRIGVSLKYKLYSIMQFATCNACANKPPSYFVGR